MEWVGNSLGVRAMNDTIISPGGGARDPPHRPYLVVAVEVAGAGAALLYLFALIWVRPKAKGEKAAGIN